MLRTKTSFQGRRRGAAASFWAGLAWAIAAGGLAGAGNSRGAALEWPEFRGPTGQGISEATNVPTEWSATKNVAWRAEIPGGGWSSPVLSGGRVYLTTATPGSDDSLSLRAICLDAKDGAKVWDVEVLRKPPGQIASIHSKNSQASPTPIVRDGKIYTHFGHLGTAALDLDGHVLWRQESLKYTPVHGNGGSPALVDGLLVFSCDAASDPFIAALDASTGEVRWKKARDVIAKRTFSFCTPLVIRANNREELILPGSGYAGSYDPRTGNEYWRARYGEGYSVVPRPVYADGLIFLSSGFDRATLYAINPEGASGDATASHIAWSTPKGAPHTPSTVAAGDEIYFIADGGVATCADARTGKVHWSERLPGDFSASPLVAEGRIYFQSEAGIGYVVKAAKTYELLAKNDLGERSLASCAVADSALYVRTQSHLWKIGAGAPAGK